MAVEGCVFTNFISKSLDIVVNGLRERLRIANVLLLCKALQTVSVNSSRKELLSKFK